MHFTINNIVIGFCALLLGSFVQGADFDPNAQALLNPSPFICTRALSLGEAISPIANGIDAPYYNPAAIGSFRRHHNKRSSLVKQLYFPYVGVGVNNNSLKLRRQLSSSNNDAAAKASIAAHEGKRQYGRVSTLFNFMTDRMIVIASSDMQTAAIKPNSEVNSPIQLRYQGRNSAGIGWSLVNKKENFYIGAYSAYNVLSTFSGEVEYTNISTLINARSYIKTKTLNYSGVSHNIGMIWTLVKKARPSFSLVVHDVGNTLYTRRDNNLLLRELKIKQNIVFGAAVSPKISRNSWINFVMEVNNLNAAELAIIKKMRASLELNIGGFGSQALWRLGLGLNSAGLSYGTSINFGLLQFEFASAATDIGLQNYRINDRRYYAVFSVNITDN